MTRILTVLMFILTIFLISCGQANKKSTIEDIETPKVRVDTSVIAIMKIDSSTYNVFRHFYNLKSTELTNNDLEKIETVLLRFTEEYNSEQEKRYEETKAKIAAKYPNSEIDKTHFIIDLNQYKRQYYAITNEKGEKEVWINCFCDSWGRNWREELILVLDGGNCYFNLKINLKTEQYYDVIVNGYA